MCDSQCHAGCSSDGQNRAYYHGLSRVGANRHGERPLAGWKTAKMIVKHEGVRGLWKGNNVALLRVVTCPPRPTSAPLLL